ncbi:asparagine synthase-related protein [Halalkalicoccus tibetensis]|uniref:Asparagine synthase-related protein n=1 Tax=Halalkalicoccus tibetensis TaxID=175632 RepID=A0ABD5V836_9EURY
MNTTLRNESDVSAFLSYRYLPGKLELSERVVKAAHSDPTRGSRVELIERGADALRKTISTIVAECSNDVRHVVPLSGGLDSRNILAAILDNVPRERILGITFGIPGTFDWELGARVARAAGVDHRHIDVRPGEFDWSRERLISSAEDCGWPTKLFRNMDSLKGGFEQHELTENCVYWHGFLGGVVSGGRLPDTESETWERAQNVFVGDNYYFPDLAAPGYDPKEHVADEPALPRDVLNYDEQLDIGLRQRYYIGPDLFGRDEMAMPFHREPFLSFMLNLPREYRVDDPIYPEIGERVAPELYQVPTENTWGLSPDAPKTRVRMRIIRDMIETRVLSVLGWPRPSKHASHFDWNRELRRSDPLQELVEPALVSLKRRNIVPWLSPTEMYREHRAGKGDHGGHIQMLTSLEMIVQASEP